MNWKANQKKIFKTKPRDMKKLKRRKADYTVISNKASSAELMIEFPKLNKDINQFKKL